MTHQQPNLIFETKLYLGSHIALIITTNSSTHYLFSCWFCDSFVMAPIATTFSCHQSLHRAFALCIFILFLQQLRSSFILLPVSFCVFSSSFCCLLVCRKFHSFFKFHYVFFHCHFVAYLFVGSFVLFSNFILCFVMLFCCLFVCRKLCSFSKLHFVFHHCHLFDYLLARSFILFFLTWSIFSLFLLWFCL